MLPIGNRPAILHNRWHGERVPMKFGIIIAAGALVLGTSAFAQTSHTGPDNGFGYDNTNSVSKAGSWSTSSAVYRVPAYAWFGGTGGGEAPGFTVTADVEMWMNMSLDATALYYHIGRDPGANPTMTSTIYGALASNNGQWLFITKPGGHATAAQLGVLDYTNDMFGDGPTSTRALQNPRTIPVSWSVVSTTTGSDVPAADLAWSNGGNAGALSGLTWLADGGTTGLHTFKINCTIAPDRYQQDGHYEMDPIVVTTPEL